MEIATREDMGLLIGLMILLMNPLSMQASNPLSPSRSFPSIHHHHHHHLPLTLSPSLDVFKQFNVCMTKCNFRCFFKINKKRNPLKGCMSECTIGCIGNHLSALPLDMCTLACTKLATVNFGKCINMETIFFNIKNKKIIVLFTYHDIGFKFNFFSPFLLLLLQMRTNQKGIWQFATSIVRRLA